MVSIHYFPSKFRNASFYHSMRRKYIKEAMTAVGNTILRFLKGLHKDEILSLFIIEGVRCLVMPRQYASNANITEKVLKIGIILISVNLLRF